MAAWYDLFRPPQSKDEKKVRYHAHSVMTGKMSTQHLIGTITRRSTFKNSVWLWKMYSSMPRKTDLSGAFLHTFLPPCAGELWSESRINELHTGTSL